MASPSSMTENARTNFARVLVVMAILLGGVFVSPLGAHTEVFERAPVAGQPIGGVVDQVNISFWAEVLTSRITLTGPDGEAIEVTNTELTSENRIASTSFPELTEPGRYVVTHTELSTDGDIQTAEFFFVLDPTSENRLLELVPGAPPGDGPNWILLLGASGLILIAAGVLWPKKSPVAVEQNSA